MSLFFIAGAVYASTTIGTDINTAGNLSVTGNVGIGTATSTSSLDISQADASHHAINIAGEGDSWIIPLPTTPWTRPDGSGQSAALNVAPQVNGGDWSSAGAAAAGEFDMQFNDIGVAPTAAGGISSYYENVIQVLIFTMKLCLD